MFVEKERWDFLATHYREDPRLEAELLHNCEDLCKIILWRKFKFTYVAFNNIEEIKERNKILKRLIRDDLINDCVYYAYCALKTWNPEKGSFYSYSYSTMYHRISYRLREEFKPKAKKIFENEIISLEEYLPSVIKE